MLSGVIAASDAAALRTALDACEARCGFWKALSYAACGLVVGVITGSAPFAWRDLATKEDLEERAPWPRERAIVQRDIRDNNQLSALNSASLEALKQTLARIEGQVSALVVMLPKPERPETPR